jgi:serine/threonine protein kinase
MLDYIPKRKTRDPTVTISGIEYPTVTINGIEYAKQQICDETLHLLKEKKPDGITFPDTPKNDSSYTVVCRIKDNFNPKEAGASSVICRLPDEKLLRVTTNESTFDDELNGLIIQYCLSDSEYVCKVYEFGYLLDTVNGKKLHVYAILEYLPIHFNGHLYRDRSVKPQIKKLLEAIDFFYSNKVSHLDIKPQNIGFNYNGQLKIFDFGFAVINRGKSFFHQVCNFVRGDWNGTYDYTDPYYLSYCTSSNISDVYSAGVIIFNTFFHLERGWGDVQIVDNYWKSLFFICSPGNPFIECYRWNTFFVRRDMTDHPDIDTPEKLESLKSLLYRMLQPNPKFRITAAEALRHPWLNEVSSRTSSIARTNTPIRTRIGTRKNKFHYRRIVTRSRISTRSKSYTPNKRPKIR